MDRAPEIWRLLRRARDLEQEAEGLRRRAGRLLRRELIDDSHEEVGPVERPTATPIPPARAREGGGAGLQHGRGRERVE